jgi:prepilin-type processing-associated H-X9-DG protein
MSADNNRRWHGARKSASDPWDHTKGPLYRYLQDGQIHTCPAFTGLGAAPGAYELGAGGYGYNEQFVGGTPSQKLDKMCSPAMEASIRNAPQTILFGDAAALDVPSKEVIEYSFVEAPLYEAYADAANPKGTKSDPSCHFRHNGRANFVFCDGHVQTMDKDLYLGVSGWTALTPELCQEYDLGFPCSDNSLFDRQ